MILKEFYFNHAKVKTLKSKKRLTSAQITTDIELNYARFNTVSFKAFSIFTHLSEYTSDFHAFNLHLLIYAVCCIKNSFTNFPLKSRFLFSSLIFSN